MKIILTVALDVDTTEVDGMSDMDYAIWYAATDYLRTVNPTDANWVWKKDECHG